MSPLVPAMDLLVSTALRQILRQSSQKLVVRGGVLGQRDRTWNQESLSQGGIIGAGNWQRCCLEAPKNSGTALSLAALQLSR